VKVKIENSNLGMASENSWSLFFPGPDLPVFLLRGSIIADAALLKDV